MLVKVPVPSRKVEVCWFRGSDRNDPVELRPAWMRAFEVKAPTPVPPAETELGLIRARASVPAAVIGLPLHTNSGGVVMPTDVTVPAPPPPPPAGTLNAPEPSRKVEVRPGKGLLWNLAVESRPAVMSDPGANEPMPVPPWATRVGLTNWKSRVPAPVMGEPEITNSGGPVSPTEVTPLPESCPPAAAPCPCITPLSAIRRASQRARRRRGAATLGHRYSCAQGRSPTQPRSRSSPRKCRPGIPG